MGFKCPICLRDFKKNKQIWKDHIEKEHKGLGKDTLNVYKYICEDTKEEKK